MKSITTQSNSQCTASLAHSLYRDHQRRLLAIATRNSFTPQDAEEAVQEAFALFIAHFDPKSKAPAIAWLTLTLKRCCWATYKRHHLSQTTTTDITNNQSSIPPRTTETPRLPEDLIELANTKSQLKTAFTNLKPQEQKALTLLALGYSYKDIAALTGWTYTKVNRCITEGRKQLRDSLSNTNNQGAGRRRGANKTSQPLTTS